MLLERTDESFVAAVTLPLMDVAWAGFDEEVEPSVEVASDVPGIMFTEQGQAVPVPRRSCRGAARSPRQRKTRAEKGGREPPRRVSHLSCLSGAQEIRKPDIVLELSIFLNREIV